jgi:hypothetical protein
MNKLLDAAHLEVQRARFWWDAYGRHGCLRSAWLGPARMILIDGPHLNFQVRPPHGSSHSGKKRNAIRPGTSVADHQSRSPSPASAPPHGEDPREAEGIAPSALWRRGPCGLMAVVSDAVSTRLASGFIVLRYCGARRLAGLRAPDPQRGDSRARSTQYTQTFNSFRRRSESCRPSRCTHRYRARGPTNHGSDESRSRTRRRYRGPRTRSTADWPSNESIDGYLCVDASRPLIPPTLRWPIPAKSFELSTS